MGHGDVDGGVNNDVSEERACRMYVSMPIYVYLPVSDVLIVEERVSIVHRRLTPTPTVDRGRGSGGLGLLGEKGPDRDK